jgi:hypothetical protein
MPVFRRDNGSGKLPEKLSPDFFPVIINFSITFGWEEMFFI